eukprot:TRINITY_DN308_c0_g1_i1.p1 TRINITY_DN308_c0_g1~~TRINITY_DN308_c0_g1_i1.p1  ORF type:complete len:141 (+),score=15.39 TRINITY_DN308_c0_g1_i1:358-780(+)
MLIHSDEDHSGMVMWKSFYILLGIFAALYCSECLKFLFFHGESIYEMLINSTDQAGLTWNQFTRLSTMLGIREKFIATFIIKEYNGKMDRDTLLNKRIDREEFIRYYARLLETYDKNNYISTARVEDFERMCTNPGCQIL